MSSRQRAFRRTREPAWNELEQLLAAKALPVDKLVRLTMLYRTAISSLAVSRSAVIDMSLQQYLENLCIRGFLAVYAPPMRLTRALAAFARDIPPSLRAIAVHLLVAAVAIGLGVVSALTLTDRFPSFAQRVIGGAAEIELYSSAATRLFLHSLPLTFLCVGLGVFMAIPTFSLLIWQGVLVGSCIAAAPAMTAGGMLLAAQIYGDTAPMIIAGAAGLRLAQAIYLPGRQGRAQDMAAAVPQVSAALVLAFALVMVLGAGGAMVWP